MLGQIVTENGQKKIKPLTADVGAGNPVGTVIVVCSNQIPSNYLPLGTQFDTSQYSVLYALLGTDTTPTASSLGLPTLTSGQYAIKATSGLSENQQDNVINTLNEQNSYFTTEHATGKKWIDGKPIYRKAYQGSLANGTVIVSANVDKLVSCGGHFKGTGNELIPVPFGTSSGYLFPAVSTSNTIKINTSINYSGEIWVEYTKTTDTATV